MRLPSRPSTESSLVTLLRRCYSSPACLRRAYPAPRHSTRCFNSSAIRADDNSTTDDSRNRIAVLGGGITGLSTAHFLRKALPNTKIVVYEASKQVGGWMRSKHVEVGNGSVLFEQGPRTLRPGSVAAWATFELIDDLKLADDLIFVPKTSPAAQNRFVYYPDHLVRMPGPGASVQDTLWSLFTEPVFTGLVPSLWNDLMFPPRSKDPEDESVSSFLSRRFGSPALGDNLVSAILHGIYAGDIDELSMRSLMPMMWHGELQVGASLPLMFPTLSGKKTYFDRDVLFLKQKMKRYGFVEEMKSASVYTFKKGIRTLSSAMEKSLREDPNVEIKLNSKPEALTYNESEKLVEVSFKNTAPTSYSRVISTIPSSYLATLSYNSCLNLLSLTPSVTVMVINLFYSDPHLLSGRGIRGFGYLLPRSLPLAANPERALGVIFDSDAAVGQDSASGTKLTVMMGGHWWSHFADYPDEEEGARMAKAVLKRHLGIDEEPVASSVALQRDCIPQYTVGHEQRMRQVHWDLVRDFGGRLAVAGNSYHGVGLNDCVRAAVEVVEAVERAGVDGEGDMEVTGLERFLEKVPSMHMCPEVKLPDA